MTPANMKSSSYRRHQPFVIAFLVGAMGLGLALVLAPPLAIEIAAVLFFLTYLTLIGFRLSGLTAQHLKAHADSDDLPAVAIIAVTLLAVAVAVVSLFQALNHTGETVWTLLIAFASVILGWLTIHTMTALHYAHLYWRPATVDGKRQHRGGMDFPATKEPCGYDFLYFAVVIGMTAQTSDVGITTTAMRKVTLLHSIVSFFFNTVLVAAAVNAAVSLAG
ncbi:MULTISPECIES: DUF1345 domain-containing protein [Agrobacterium]|jgi:uncharacterized membrane protein|uniref:Transmembrane protein n=2 Tax=Agrobacterium tumefaciens complex TaxID=1183400 RepID=A0A1S7QMK1_AGRTU|nr:MULTISPECIES: DUF1345 domain-containing protein [Agrobacterium tumefaciens complex]TGE82688.1 DUF1345 domain-containing protein [Rhizobium sp. SEMIA 439]AYM80985.1 membrane protein [Agrobacterium tumefaciens]KAA1236839.1 DUF1345 domain-containing protein [Agrobacterium tumefaciens]MBB4280700.1 putative membrane protein [Agrobacterium radiobacter]MBB4317318.1 putative membrane protein [Agrobacterium radiobacter]